MKRTMITLLTLLVMVLTTSNALADNVRTSGLYTYEIKGNGTITIIDFDWERNQGDIYIPNTIDGYTITAISPEAFAEKEYDASRSECIVRLPASVTMIGEKAFMNAPVSAINIPINTQYIGVGAFANCPLSQFNVEPGNPIFATIDGVLYNKTKKSLVAYPREAGRIVIPEGIVRIDDYAFYGVELVDDTNRQWGIGDMLPSTLVEIGDYAFAESKLGIYSFIPESVTRIGAYAFYNSHLEERGHSIGTAVVIGNNSLSIGNGAFQNAYLYSKHTEQTKVNAVSIGDNAFSGFTHSAKSHLFLSSEITSIGLRAFKDINYQQNKIRICLPTDTQVSFIGEEAFALSEVYMGIIEEGVIGSDYYYSVEDSVFTLPEGITTIERNAFNAGFYKLHNDTLIIPEGVNVIEENAFANNENLRILHLPSTLTTIKAGAFKNTSISSVTIPVSVNEIGKDAFDRTDVTLIVEQGSFSALWAQENGYSYKYENNSEDDLSWLN